MAKCIGCKQLVKEIYETDEAPGTKMVETQTEKHICQDCVQMWIDEESVETMEFKCASCGKDTTTASKSSAKARICWRCVEQAANLLSSKHLHEMIDDRKKKIETLQEQITSLTWRLMHERFVEKKEKEAC